MTNPSEKMKAWLGITAGLKEIEDAADFIEGFDLDEGDQIKQVRLIKEGIQSVRSAAHAFLRPDLELEE
jgi:hypothetical protein